MNALSRTRTFRSMMLVGVVLLGASSVRLGALHRPRTALVQACGALLLLLVARLASRARSERSARRLMHLGLGLAVVVIATVSTLSGQHLSAATFGLSLIGPVAAYVLGVRPAVAWSLVGIGALTIVDHAERWFHLRPEFVQGANDRFIQHVALSVVLVFVAGLARRAYEAKLAELEAREATIRKQADDLARARDRALEVSRLKSDFLATMSHELRTPLNGVLGMTTLLADTQLGREQREMVSLIAASGDALLVTLNDVLDFSKIEAGKLELDEAPFDVRDCVDGTLEVLTANALVRDLELAAVVHDDVPARLVGDAARLQQILVNLVGNALKFTERGEVVLTVSYAQGALRVCVRDTGIGIAPDRISMLFEPFTQADASTTRRFGGTGLGLAIVRRLCERMGGRVWAESALDEGSTFDVELPLAPASPASTRLDLHGAPVLVVEAHAPTREGLAAALRSLDARPIGRADPSEVSVEDLGGVRVALLDATGWADGELRAALGSRRIEVVGHLRPGAPVDDAPFVVRPARRAPLFDALSSALGQKDRVPSLAPGASPEGGSLHVLVAEDNPVSQRVARLLLERLGHRVVVVGNGREALEALRARRYDALLTDVQMPDVDGLETARRVRAELPREAQPWIVAMTASALPEQREACRRAGMDDFVAKPVQVAELAAAIERARRSDRPRSLGSLSRLPVPRVALIDEARFDALRVLTDGDLAALAALVADFSNGARRLVAAMGDALVQRDVEELRRAAHSLKGNAGTFAAPELGQRAAQIEALASAQGLDASAAEIAAIGGILDDTLEELKRRVRVGP